MPQRSKKDHKRSHHSDSRWHNFHFSGKLILCSVIFGFLLILIGGILLAIGMDRDEDTKSDDYEDLQKKPPLMFVGPVIMGIGGFTVIVGVIMCLVETKVFRSRAADSNPLINGEGESARRESEAGGIESNSTAIPSSSHNERNRDGHHKKSNKRIKNNKKSHSHKSKSQKEASSSGSLSSEPIPINSPKNFLSASDKFLTPQNSFSPENMPMQKNSRDATNQTSASLMKSFTSSEETWNASTEFQTPSTSLNDNSPTFQYSQNSSETPSPPSVMSIPITPIGSVIQNERHAFLTPKNSSAEILEETPRRVETLKQENAIQDNKHEFLTPKNSNAEILDEPKGPLENGLKLTNSVSKDQEIPIEISAVKPTAISVIADVHTSPKQESSKEIETCSPLNAQEIQHPGVKDGNQNTIDPKSHNSNDSLISKPPLSAEVNKINSTKNEQNANESNAGPSNLLNSESEGCKEENCDNVSDHKKDDILKNHDVGNTHLQNGEQLINEVISEECDTDKTSSKEVNDLKDK